MDKPIRVDSYLWAVRIFKTRTLAQEACKKGRVSINGQTAKPAKLIAVGDTLAVRKPPVTFSFKVLQTATNRMNAKLVPGYLQNITPKEEYEVLQMQKLSGFIDRSRGLGRPTKKERRDLEQFIQEAPLLQSQPLNVDKEREHEFYKEWFQDSDEEWEDEEWEDEEDENAWDNWDNW